jgi:hypothetical protein
MSVLIKLIITILISMSLNSTIIYDFSETTSIEDWQIVNDGVMGGLSNSTISLSEDNHGKFEGHVSLENNGGFASVRLLTDVDIKPDEDYIELKVKGDGKTYQFRLKGKRSQRQSYVQEFKTSGEWQTIKLKINQFSPQFRGRPLDFPNFEFSSIEEIRFLIANKKEQDFKLLIDAIILK